MRLLAALLPALLIVPFSGPLPKNNDEPTPIKVDGKIENNSTWKGQVHVTGPVTVAEGAVLTVKPGTRVTFAAGASLTVAGRLLAEASDKEPIAFAGGGRGPAGKLEAGAWGGIIVAGVGSAGSCLSGCRIVGAVDAITLMNDSASGLRVAGCTIASCTRAGIRLDGVKDAVIEGNRISNCGLGSTHGQAGGICLDSADSCMVRDNSIENCGQHGVLLLHAHNNTAQGNRIKGIGGKRGTSDGHGISVATGSSGNLLLSNQVNGANYVGIYLGNSPNNLVIDNEVRNAPDGIGITGPQAVGNLVRNNRIYGCYWSQLYLTSQCRDNRIENTDIWGGDGAITSWAAGPNTFEGCDFHGTGPIALLGTSQVILRRCTISTKGPEDLWTEFQPTCSVIDCNLDRKRIGFSKGTTKDSQIIWKHAVEVKVTDSKTGQPIRGATVTVASAKGAEKLVQSTSANGVAILEVTEGVLSKGGQFSKHTPHSITVRAEGFEPLVVNGANVNKAMKRAVLMRRR